MTTDPNIITAKAIGNVFWYASVFKALAAKRSHDLDGSSRTNKAAECLLRGARDAAKAMGTGALFPNIDYAASKGNTTSTQKQVTDLVAEITNHRKEQGR